MSAHSEQSLPGHDRNTMPGKDTTAELALAEALDYLGPLPAELRTRLTVRRVAEGQEIELVVRAPFGWRLREAVPAGRKSKHAKA